MFHLLVLLFQAKILGSFLEKQLCVEPSFSYGMNNNNNNNNNNSNNNKRFKCLMVGEKFALA